MCVSDRDAGRTRGPGGGEAGGEQEHASDSLERLERLRDAVSECDRELIEVLSRRRGLVRELGAVKARMGIPVTDPQREAVVVRRAAEMARAAGLDEELIRNLIWRIMSSARVQQYTPTGEEKPQASS